MDNFSIIIVTFNRISLLNNCLKSIYNIKENAHVYVVINGLDIETDEYLKDNFPNVIVINSNKVTPGEARNLAMEKVTSDFAFFLDDDTILPESYFSEVACIFKKNPKLEIFGGPDRDYPNASAWENALSLTLTSPLATANTRHRHSKGPDLNSASEEKLILCNLWIKSSIFKKGLIFDKRFFRNEENVFLFLAKERNIDIKYFSDLFVFHKRKNTFNALFNAVSQSGANRLKSFLIFPSSIKFIYFVPFLFSTYLISLVLHGFYEPLFCYLIINTIFSFKISDEKMNFLKFLRIYILHFFINFSYGLGFYLQIFKQFKFQVQRQSQF